MHGIMYRQLVDGLCGAAFGSALYAAGVYAPKVIIEQLQWTNLDMLRTFLAASASSALVFKIAETTGYAPNPVRCPGNLGVFSFDANMLGGALVGAGMALTGACPGTAIVQAAALIPAGSSVLLGGILGGVLYHVTRTTMSRGGGNPPRAKAKRASTPSATVSPWVLFGAWEVACILAIRCTYLVAPPKRLIGVGLVSPVAGGLLLGFAQGLTMVLRKTPLGVSTAYEDCGRFISSYLNYDTKASRLSEITTARFTPSIIFALGVFLGAWTVSLIQPASAAAVSATTIPAHLNQRFAVSFAGGAIMIVGARLAGGCTSGHGITGMSALSPASMVTVASMFVAGTLVALSRA